MEVVAYGPITYRSPRVHCNSWMQFTTTAALLRICKGAQADDLTQEQADAAIELSARRPVWETVGVEC